MDGWTVGVVVVAVALLAGGIGAIAAIYYIAHNIWKGM